MWKAAETRRFKNAHGLHNSINQVARKSKSGREENGKIIAAPDARSDAKGIVKVRLDGAGKWYVKFINMTKLDDPNLNYESKWTTLTFELKQRLFAETIQRYKLLRQLPRI